MSRFRFRYTFLGDHVHIRVFVGHPDQTFAKCGELVMRAYEFDTLRMVFRIANSAYIEIVPDNNPELDHRPAPPDDDECPR